MKIDGAVALVTGGAKGLGRSIAAYLAERGASVVVVDRDRDALADLDQDLEGHELDVTIPAAIPSVMRQIIASHGRIDLLINNAGLIHSEPFVNVFNPTALMHDYDRFCEVMRVNLHSVFIMTAAVVEQMVLKRSRGCIINISSISGEGNAGQTAYSAAKAGVNAMTVTWAKELGPLGIRCNAVAPGFIATEATQQALTAAVLKHITDNTPLRRLGVADEIAHSVAYLIENDFVNGTILGVNGGLSI